MYTKHWGFMNVGMYIVMKVCGFISICMHIHVYISYGFVSLDECIDVYIYIDVDVERNRCTCVYLSIYIYIWDRVTVL